MTDDELERLVRRYAPAAPQASLRARVVAGAAQSHRRAWPWAAAAAALLALTLRLHGATVRALSVADVNASWSSRAEEEALLTELLGGGDDARSLARAIAVLDDARQTHQPVGTTGVIEGVQ